MSLITTEEPEQILWEGHLEPIEDNGQEAIRAAASPRISLGAPSSWPATALEAKVGAPWVPPLEDHHYVLVRLACTLHPLDDARTQYTEATLAVILRPKENTGDVIAHDLYPVDVEADGKTSYTVELAPELTFGDTGIKLGSINRTFECKRVFPVIKGYGISEPEPYWHFKHHDADPLLGSQSTYMMLRASPNAGGIRMGVKFTVVVQDHLFGRIRYGPPKASRKKLRYLIPLDQAMN